MTLLLIYVGRRAASSSFRSKFVWSTRGDGVSVVHNVEISVVWFCDVFFLACVCVCVG